MQAMHGPANELLFALSEDRIRTYYTHKNLKRIFE